jgi:hypothetical protein
MYESGRFNHVPIVVLTVRDEGSVLVNRSFPSDLTPAVYDAEIEAEFGTGDAPTIRARYPLAAFRSPKDALARITADVESVCEAREIAAVARAGFRWPPTVDRQRCSTSSATAGASCTGAITWRSAIIRTRLLPTAISGIRGFSLRWRDRCPRRCLSAQALGFGLRALGFKSV